MSNYFRSFQEITNVQEGKVLLSMLKERDKYLAHSHKTNSKETIEKHLRLVVEYFLKLVESHHLDSIVDKLILSSIPESFADKSKVGNFIKEAFYKTILYHDFGKVNHLFQWNKKKMNNPRKDLKVVNHKVDSQHSIISAYIYLIHLLDNEGLEFDEHEQVLIDALISSLTYSIVKHHGKYLHSVLEINFKGNENAFAEYLELFETEMPDDLEFLHEIITDFETTFEQFDNLKTNLFSIYALIKLNFSLLTAPDYYATGEYMQDLKVDDYGLIEGYFRKKIINNFKSTKDYNKALFEKMEALKNVPFADLQTQSKVNLNRLRQKLAADVLSNLRKYPNHNLFYLEAPTGAGKTNISLAIATELLDNNPELNKIFYVFPFTTLITQTFGAIKETLEIDNEHIIQLHAKSGFHQQNEESNDGNYGKNRMNFMNNHFVNYPITLLTHIKFFDILKGNSKETNYIYHRLANSIVIIDELQSYNPKHWDKVIFFLSNYAQLFNMKIILMSATLPKIDNLLDEKSEMRGKVKYLLSKENKPHFFQNPNFAGRISFDFSILDKFNWKRPKSNSEKDAYLAFLKDKIFEKSEKYAQNNSLKANSVRTLIEFITKKTASKFFKSLKEDERFSDYQFYLISGEILDPRRKEIIEAIKDNKDEKVILVTTQVVESGVDIDMDLGFKDRSLIDSDEQLAGRVNRNASKQNCMVFMFDFDATAFIYKEDKRLKVKSMYERNTYKSILESKNFDTDFYDEVKEEIIQLNQSASIQNLNDYLANFKRFNFHEIKNQFKLIEQENESVFVPLPIPKEHFDAEDLIVLEYFDILDFENEEGIICINGEDIWDKYAEIIGFTQERRGDYFVNQTKLKQIYGILSKFMFSSFKNQIEKMKPYLDNREGFTDYEQFGLYYFSRWEEIYCYEGGLDMSKIDSDVFI